MAATGTAKGKLGKVPTAYDGLPENRNISMQTPGTDTQGTGFQTVKASANEEQRAINQSKENIILSEQSSFKQIDWNFSANQDLKYVWSAEVQICFQIKL